MDPAAFLASAGAILPAAVATAGGLLHASLRRPRPDPEEAVDVLILAAHPDDCVILAGDYAIDAARAGRRVDIVYLTCGDVRPGTDLAERRKKEAFAAWALAGVPPERFTFLDLPQSDVDAASAQRPEELAAAKARLEDLLKAAPAGAAVFFPAAEESHVDHRVLRRLALEALAEAGRSDLRPREAAEYNTVYSLVGGPGRAIGLLLDALPLLGRLRRSGPRPSDAGFAGPGPRPRRRPADAARDTLKARMLRCFASQGADKVVAYFGAPGAWREVDVRRALARREGAGLLAWAGRRYAPSMAILVLTLLLSLSALGVAGALAFHRAGILAAAGLLFTGAVAAAWRGRRSLRLPLLLAFAAGWILGVIAITVHETGRAAD
jgi:hypothetical protein